MKLISSKHNETYKFLVKISKKSNARKKNQKFIVEGLKEIINSEMLFKNYDNYDHL